jgi:hypothetical protein
VVRDSEVLHIREITNTVAGSLRESWDQSIRGLRRRRDLISETTRSPLSFDAGM